jgi:hypothetical protein
MNSLYWLILGGLVAVVVLVLVVAVSDVLVTANRGLGRTTPRRGRIGNQRTEAPGVLAPDDVERFNGEAHTQPLYRRDGRWIREP